MRGFLKIIFALFIFCQAFSVFGKNADTNKMKDTLVVPQDKIQNVQIACNTGSILAKPEMISSEREFDKFFGKDCTTNPPVDFTTQTLLFFPTKTSGCKVSYERTVKIYGYEATYNVNTITDKECDVLLFNSNSIAIPKIDPRVTVHFKKSETTIQKTK